MSKRARLLYVLAACLVLESVAWAETPLERIRGTLGSAFSMRAHFTQQVISREGKKSALVSGHIAVQRPGLFRWAVEKPFNQLIVADGQSLWLWDADLNQVTQKKQGNALAASPAAILAGEDARIETDFELTALPEERGLQWVEAVPKRADFGFERIRLGFKGADLAEMDLKDSFAQTTILKFSELERGHLKPELFRFRPPPGADLIRE
jgi:outer membrane lipoprotein carrier protein